MAANYHSLSTKNSTNPSLVNRPTQQMLSLGRRNGWGFHILGYADLPEKPVHLEKWLIIPAQEDNSPIPKRTMERIQTIFAGGLRPQGFVVVHEAPRTLAEGKQPHMSLCLPASKTQQTVSQTPVESASPSGSSSLSNLMEGLGSMLSVFATTIFPMLFFGLLALDPIVVAVMDDGCWIEIDRWFIQ
jgi:hypothetical protein